MTLIQPKNGTSTEPQWELEYQVSNLLRCEARNKIANKHLVRG